VCRDCYRLGPAELAYQSAVANIDGALRGSEIIPRRQRHQVEHYLDHGEPRIRAHAAEVIARDAAARRAFAVMLQEEEQAMLATMGADGEAPPSTTPPLEHEPYGPGWTDFEDEDIPF